MEKSFIAFLTGLPADKLTALAKPLAKAKGAVVTVQNVLDKFGVLAWEKLLDGLETSTIETIAKELAVSVDAVEHRRTSLINAIALASSNKTHESLAALSNESNQLIWVDLGIKHALDAEMIVEELFIGGMQALIGQWTVTHMNSVISSYSITTRSTWP